MKRPIRVTILGWLFIVAGVVGLGYHLSERPLDRWVALISFIRVLAIVVGVFLLKGRNWARWLMTGWLGFHVGVSALHSLSECLAHAVLFLVVAYFLLTPPDSQYFQASPPE
ncbi:MAG TPA: hypothetical protein VH140_10895 [Candidatus Acidoferrum sp.]|nr:hypothetical protein [Candidatus Acidoferrum sp.]